MGELINGRTPEEIKHVAEWNCYSCGGLECDDCSYLDACTVENRDRAVPDALALIEHLESERDAALASLFRTRRAMNSNPAAQDAYETALGDAANAEEITLNTLRDEVYEDAVKHGLYDEEDNVQGWPVECAAMIECETDELYEAAQEWEDSPVDDNEHFIEELADVIIMSLSVAGKLGIDIDAAVRKKIEFNKTRPWKHEGEKHESNPD